MFTADTKATSNKETMPFTLLPNSRTTPPNNFLGAAINLRSSTAEENPLSLLAKENSDR